MKKTVFAAAILATTLLTTGCAAEAVTGVVAEQAAQGNAGPVSSGVDVLQKSKERLEAKAYTSRIAAEHESMLAGQEWKLTGAGWTAGAAVTVTLTSAAGTAVGAPVHAVVDAQGRIDTSIILPEGTTTGPYTLVATDPADASGPHTASVNIFAQ
jgi:outer membrane murein-binding lipoprotein Lpp